MGWKELAFSMAYHAISNSLYCGKSRFCLYAYVLLKNDLFLRLLKASSKRYVYICINILSTVFQLVSGECSVLVLLEVKGDHVNRCYQCCFHALPEDA